MGAWDVLLILNIWVTIISIYQVIYPPKPKVNRKGQIIIWIISGIVILISLSHLWGFW